mmetsp:Transcript_24208/g.66275  ORF Transcript_24208/g.66275 Transcript_24208/m.66275 type:complete len:219 (+) Transcript_24208:1426-2082(+)
MKRGSWARTRAWRCRGPRWVHRAAQDPVRGTPLRGVKRGMWKGRRARSALSSPTAPPRPCLTCLACCRARTPPATPTYCAGCLQQGVGPPKQGANPLAQAGTARQAMTASEKRPWTTSAPSCKSLHPIRGLQRPCNIPRPTQQSAYSSCTQRRPKHRRECMPPSKRVPLLAPPSSAPSRNKEGAPGTTMGGILRLHIPAQSIGGPSPLLLSRRCRACT